VYVKAIVCVLLLFAVACTPVPPAADGIGASETVRDSKSLVAHLRQAGLRVESAGQIEQPFFTAKAKVLRIGDSGEAQVYEYASEERAAAEAARVNADGSIGTSMPMWIAPPHFFRKGSLIVLYLGSDERTLSTLQRLLGAQFAGQ